MVTLRAFAGKTFPGLFLGVIELIDMSIISMGCSYEGHTQDLGG
jgi:hypothetical protein